MSSTIILNEHRSIELLPLYDLHIGSPHSHMPLIKRAIKYIADTPNCYTFLGGDIVNNANITGNFAEAVYDEEGRPQDQVMNVVDMLKPIQDKILFAVGGNHGRWTSAAGYNPDSLVAHWLDIPYEGDIHVFGVKFAKGQKIFTVIAHHGFGGGRKEGNKVQKCIDLRECCVNANLVLAGHTHIRNWVAGAVSFWGKGNWCHTDQHYVTCGSAYGPAKEGYAARKAMRPLLPGLIIVELLPCRENNRYKINFRTFD